MSIGLWGLVIVLTGFDLGHRMQGIVVGVVGLMATVTTLATIQVWCVDHINARAPGVNAVTGHGTYRSVDPNSIRWLITRNRAVGRASMEDATVQLPPPASVPRTEDHPDWAKVYELGRESQRKAKDS